MDHEPFLPAEDGPFECDDCQFFTGPNQCHQPNMIQLYGPADPGADYTSGPDGQVSEKACCDWFHNKSDQSE